MMAIFCFTIWIYPHGTQDASHYREYLPIHPDRESWSPLEQWSKPVARDISLDWFGKKGIQKIAAYEKNPKKQTGDPSAFLLPENKSPKHQPGWNQWSLMRPLKGDFWTSTNSENSCCGTVVPLKQVKQKHPEIRFRQQKKHIFDQLVILQR